MFMDNNSVPAGRVQSPSAARKESMTRDGLYQTGQPTNALDAQNVATQPGDAGIPTFNPDAKSPSSPLIGSTSPASTAVSSPQSEHRRFTPPNSQNPARDLDTMSFDSLLATLAKLAAFTDVFLSGLVIPLIPSILETRTGVPRQQVQIWTSVAISAYGGAFAVISPLMPLLTRRGPSLYAVLFAGLGCAAAAFALLQHTSNLHLLILARVLQGLAGAATTAACSGMLATIGTASGQEGILTSFSPAFTQNMAMMVAPAIAGLLNDYYDANAVFYCAYALVALNFLLGLVAARFSPTVRLTNRSREPQSPGYGTIVVVTGEPDFSSRSSRSVSPTSTPFHSTRYDRHASLSGPAAWSPRLLVALHGYLVVGLLASALQSVLPLFAQRYLHWSVSASGFMFVPLSAPAALIGPLAGMLAVRIPKSARFLTTIGFLAIIPALLYLGQLRENMQMAKHALLVALSGLSFALGLCGDPLIKEIMSVVGSSAANNSWGAAAQATSLPNLANAWGSLVGPLLAGGVSWVWGWETMNKSLAMVGAGTGLITLFFLQGWIGSPHPDLRSRRAEASSDEESAPLLANDRSNHAASYDRKPASYTRGDSSDDHVSPHTRPSNTSSRDGKPRPHRRHFSVDNFSIATTAAAPGSLDSTTSSVRFQAALETPAITSTSSTTATPRLETSDSFSSRTTAAPERRYVMREAPHAPATDPLLAAGSLYVIDEERDAPSTPHTNGAVDSSQTQRIKKHKKKRVVVFAEGAAPPELLERHRHHVVAINALDGSAQMVEGVGNNGGGRGEGHAVAVTEEDEGGFEEGQARRYVVVVVEEEEGEE